MDQPDLSAIASDLSESFSALSTVSAMGLPDLLARIDALKARIDALEQKVREEAAAEEAG